MHVPASVKEERGKEGSRKIVDGISPGLGGNYKKKMSMQLLRGELAGPAQDLIVANISPILVLHGNATDMKDGAEMARKLIADKVGYERAKLYVQTLGEILRNR